MDEPALVVLGSLLSGRTGRLYKSLVLDQKIANSVAAGQNGMKWAGYFLLERSSQSRAARRKSWNRLSTRRSKSSRRKRSAKGNCRRSRTSLQRIISGDWTADSLLMLQILLADSNRGWQSFNEDPKKIAAVTAEDIQRVANQIFQT